MKKVLLSTALLLAINLPLNAGIIDDAIKKQCKTIVHGNGTVDSEWDMFLVGIVDGMKFAIDEKVVTKASNDDIKYSACRQSLNNTAKVEFFSKFEYFVFQIIKGEKEL